MEIIRGKIPCAKKVTIYGPEGIGKSTIASKFPDPVFIDTEGSTKDMDVARTPAPSSWSMLLEQVRHFIANPHELKTLVIDTADWAEQLCAANICARYQKNGIEDFGYGKGYTYLQEEFGRLLNLLTELVEEKGVNVVLTAHAKMRKFEQPDELGAYDRWEMKLSKQVAPMVKEYSDMVLFANYKTIVVNVDGQGAAKGRNKAQGGKRVMHTTHHNCWDAKNRHGLPDEVDFDYAAIAHIIERRDPTKTAAPEQAADRGGMQAEEIKNEPERTKADEPGCMPMPQDERIQRIPKPLRDLMMESGVDEWDIQNVVAAKGYYPSDTPIENYDGGFINGVLVEAWPKVYKMIQESKAKLEIPFN